MYNRDVAAISAWLIVPFEHRFRRADRVLWSVWVYS
jgi:hypothetical protein